MYTEPRVLESPRGWLLTFAELTSFAAAVRQVIDGVFVGCESSTRLPTRSDDDLTISSQSDILVAAVDSSFYPDRGVAHTA